MLLFLSTTKAFPLLARRFAGQHTTTAASRISRPDRSFTSSSLHDQGTSSRGERETGVTSGNSVETGWRAVPLDKVVTTETTYSQEDFAVLRKVDLRPITSPHKPSPVEVVTVRGRKVYIKRDDLLRLEGSTVSGNKARKLFALNQIPAADFPKCVVSYGGSQSNAMLALAAVVQSKNMELTGDQGTDGESSESDYEATKEELEQRPPPEKRFVYYSKKLPRFLRKNPSGNYFRAKTLGMEMVEVTNDEYRDLFGGDSGGKPHAPPGLDAPVDADSVWVR